ncbi:sensor histidine kinase [Couchioplanes caeruleus]|uniref:histidine kinase n=2 Tax=Couchioplanes caeruleus TaxID=56438 RepID=A0A1K0GNE9_9ACTN|nr:histidine kinase [Couchioplanes caeruleus]OJF13886.1 two-component sensor histidine kinase [Couchioplanes caeruleus subsp. caeruleus]ROP30710.1 signal transduction histidine kinase [Couchioplanes caeruleus]
MASFTNRALGYLAGILTALLEAGYLVAGGIVLGPAMLWPRTRPAAVRRFLAGVRWLTGLELRRRSRFFGDVFPADRDERKTLPYLAARLTTGLLSGVVVGLLGFGVVLVVLLTRGVIRGSVGIWELLAQVLLGGVLLFLDVQGIIALAALDGRLARRYFGPSERELLKRRIAELSTSRAGIVRAVDRERQRIERDLHDGVQQRLVALAMLLGRARRHRDPVEAGRLLEQAHRASEEVLVELREVAWRAYPSALDNLGLPEALAGVAERAGIPVRIDLDLPARLPRPVETATYFVVSEAVTNAVKHSGATAIAVVIGHGRGRVHARITDDGGGGADPAGSGLSGLGLRVAALDGELFVSSPPGGPTEITVEIPCE